MREPTSPLQYAHIAWAWTKLKTQEAYQAVKYSVGFLCHVARNRHRYMLEFDRMTEEEERIQATVAELRKQNEALMKRHGTTLDRFEKESDSFRLEGKPVPKHYNDPEEVVAKTTMSPEVARNTADRVLKNQTGHHPDAINNNNQFLSSGPREDKIGEVVKH